MIIKSESFKLLLDKAETFIKKLFTAFFEKPLEKPFGNIICKTHKIHKNI